MYVCVVSRVLGWVFVTQTAYKARNCGISPTGDWKEEDEKWQETEAAKGGQRQKESFGNAHHLKPLPNTLSATHTASGDMNVRRQRGRQMRPNESGRQSGSKFY